MEEKKLIIISVAIFILTLIFSFFLQDQILSTNLIFLGVIILLVPYSIFRLMEFKKIKSYEESFPNFLRDLAESQRAGLSILQSLKLAAKSDYGSLSDEIKKINSQLSWNVPLETVLQNFIKRMKKSKIIVRSVLIIQQNEKSGGDVKDIMDSLANNMETLKDIQEEKNILLNQQVMMMYAIFFIFLGISIALLKFLIPLLQSDFVGGNNVNLISQYNPNPCYDCLSSNVNPSCAACNIFFAVSDSIGFGEKEEAESYYKSVFFTMIIIQGIFSGLIAGQISSDSVSAGVKHSLVMTISGVFIFVLVSNLGFI